MKEKEKRRRLPRGQGMRERGGGEEKGKIIIKFKYIKFNDRYGQKFNPLKTNRISL